MAIDHKYAVEYQLSHIVANEGDLNLSNRELTNAGIRHLSRCVSGLRGRDNAEALTHLNLYKTNIDDESVPSLIRIVKRARHLKTLNISENNFSGEGLSELLDALKDHKGLRLLNIGNNPLGEKGAHAVASFIASSTGMEELQAHHSSFGDGGLAAIGKAIAESKSPLTRINLAMNGGLQKSAHAIGDAIIKHEEITSIHVTQENESFNDTAKEAFAKTRNPNLLHVSPVNAQVAVKTEANRAAARKASINILKKPETLSYDELAFVAQREPAAIRTPTQGLLPYNYHISRFDDHLKQLPKLPAAGREFGETLFKPDDKGYAPLDNPTIWKDWAAVEKGLDAASVVPNDEFLQKKTPRGVSFLQSAAGAAPTEKIVSYLLKFGKKLGEKDLLGEDQKPNALFQAFIDRRDIADIFTSNNWLGKSPRELTAVYSALPDSLKKEVPIHALRQDIRPSAHGRGR